MVEDSRTVLRPNVVALTVQRRRVVDGEEHIQQVAVADHARIERYLHRLGMSGITGAYRPVSRIGDVTARIAGNHVLDALQLVVDRFQTPETTARQRRYFTVLSCAHMESSLISKRAHGDAPSVIFY